MKVYTKTGDLGETTKLNGERISKNNVLVHFIGTADELNSYLGLVKVMLFDVDSKMFIEGVQINLMKAMAHSSDTTNGKYLFSEKDVEELENEIDRLSANIPKIFQFVLPGKSEIEAHIQVARAVARRLERLFVAVNKELALSPYAGKFLNRLSDYLFVLSQQEW